MNGSGRNASLRSVAVPSEHGGWGLTLEPGILGVLLAPSVGGVLLGIAAVLLFLARTPSRLVLISRRRGDRPATAIGQERVRLARIVTASELAAAGVAVLVTAAVAEDPGWWLPLVIAAPLLGFALWSDVHARGRQLLPELAGSVAVAGVAASGALAGGAAWPLAVGAWLVLSARVASSVPHVRAQVRRIHGREPDVLQTAIGDTAALALATVAFVLERSLWLGALAIVGLIAVQRVTLARPPRPAKILGVRQMALGFAVVGLTALGTWTA